MSVNLFNAKQHMQLASKELVHCVIELQREKDVCFDKTKKEVLAAVGDLQVAIEILEQYGA